MKALIFAALVVLVSAPAFAQGEQIALTAPIVQPAPATITNYAPVSLTVKVASLADAHPAIDVVIVAPDGSLQTFHYPNAAVAAFSTEAQVATLINQLNTVNLSTRSLWRRVFDRLCTDFPAKFPGGCSVP